ncbi:MAG: DNA helicase RecQ [Blastocatellia bacterium]|nr:DNA helicase RecQ [Blastocatellia bacterium]
MTITLAREILQTRFGYESFRMHQEPAIASILAGKDCLLLMPTGGGKSVCYQIPAMIFDGLTLVVSPLIALMKDQVDALQSNGIAAAFLNSSQSSAEQVEVFRAVRSGEVKLLYVAPERLFQSGDRFIEFLRSISVSLFAIDEAHCISSWGHDFRPEYQRLARLKKDFQQVPLIALTATADALVRQDIVRHLAIPDAEIFVSSFNRPNIRYTVEPKRDSYGRLLDFISDRKDESGIIYCLSRASVERLADDLGAEGYAALPYHAGLDRSARDRNQTAFLNDDARIIIATIAFGMGIDKSNVRYVVHMDLPKNIESYYQETGRAGRDGLPSEALLFFSWGDVAKLKGFVEVDGNAEQSSVMLRKLDQMGEFGDLRSCRRRYLLNYFDEEMPDDCGHCDNCDAEFETFDGTVIAQKALSAAVRTGQRFGASYLIDLLRGSKSQKMRLEHLTLKTYGVGADISKDDWHVYFRDLIAQSLLKKTAGEYPTLLVTESGNQVLRGERSVQLYKVTHTDSSRSDRTETADYHKELFEELRQVRFRLAESRGVPPYVIFSDAALIEMATVLPQTDRDFTRISGVGAFKLKNYGPDFLAAIRAYCTTRGITPDPVALRPARRQKQPSNRTGPDTHSQTLTLFRSGLSVDEIAARRGLAVSTIESHLALFIADGRVQVEELVTPEKMALIKNALIDLKVENAIGPVKQHLGDDFSYGEIKAVLAHLELGE